MRLQAHFCGCPKSVCVAKNTRRGVLSRGCHGAHRSEGRALLAVVCGARPGTDSEAVCRTRCRPLFLVALEVCNEVSNPRTLKNQGTLGPSLALECKCAFGAKIIFLNFIFVLFSLSRKCAPAGALLWMPKIRVRRQK